MKCESVGAVSQSDRSLYTSATYEAHFSHSQKLESEFSVRISGKITRRWLFISARLGLLDGSAMRLETPSCSWKLPTLFPAFLTICRPSSAAEHGSEFFEL